MSGSAVLRTLDPIAGTDVANKQYVDSFGQWGKVVNNISYTAGNVGIGTVSPAYTLQVNGQVAGTTAFMTTSDLRFKKDINNITNPLDKLLSIKGVSYKFRNDEFPEFKFSKRRELGVIAQNVEKVFPEAVSQDSNGFRSVAYTMLISPIIEAIREVNSQTKKLEAENKMLKSYLCERDPNAPFCEH